MTEVMDGLSGGVVFEVPATTNRYPWLILGVLQTVDADRVDHLFSYLSKAGNTCFSRTSGSRSMRLTMMASWYWRTVATLPACKLVNLSHKLGPSQTYQAQCLHPGIHRSIEMANLAKDARE